MERFEEMLRLDLDLDILGNAVVDHQRAQQRGFGFDIARQFGAAGFGGSDFQ